jgi:hypothetical protein
MVIGIAASASAKPPGNFYGMNLGAVPTARESKRLAHGGVKVARYPFDWRNTQPHRNDPYQWDLSDLVVTNLARAGITTLPILYGSPPWIHKNYRRPPLHPAGARTAWRRMVKAVVARYAPDGSFWTAHPALPYRPIRHWEVWNEPNIPGFFAPRASPRRYARLLHISAAAIRFASPKAKVVMAGLSPGSHGQGQMFSWKFLNRLYERGAGEDFDILAIHPFALRINGVAAQLKKIRAVASRHGDGRKPMWIDELGWASGHDRSNPFASGAAGQARLLHHAFHYVLKHRRALGIGALDWVLWRDRDNFPSCLFCRSGLIRELGKEANPAWRTYKRFAQH